MNSMMMERAACTPSMPTQGNMPMGMNMPMTMGMPQSNMMMVPRCKLKFEKCEGGFKIHCVCEDEMSCSVMQNMCRMLCDGMCSTYCMCNGMCVCQCNMTMGMCKTEYTKDGCCITCTSGDKACCDMLQACCDAMMACCKSGCCCYVCFNGTPVCCGCC